MNLWTLLVLLFLHYFKELNNFFLPNLNVEKKMLMQNFMYTLYGEGVSIDPTAPYKIY